MAASARAGTKRGAEAFGDTGFQIWLLVFDNKQIIAFSVDDRLTGRWHGTARVRYRTAPVPRASSAGPSEKFLRRRMGFKFPYDAGIFFTTVMSA
jgi:hypothetical protein